jgi:hypothetical protein
MTSVFVGGSRAASKLNDAIRGELDNLIGRGCHILIGDATGADRAVQQYFSERGYRNVTVFCADACRNNVGGWPWRTVPAGSARRDFSYYAAKDVVMAREAKCGVMLWDGRSKGTLHNILNLTRAGKKTLVYLAPDKSFYKLAGAPDLQTLLARCDPRAISRAELGLSAATLPPQGSLPLPLP